MCGQTVLMGFDLTWGGTGSENHLVVSLSEVGTEDSSKHMDTYLAFFRRQSSATCLLPAHNC